MPSYAVSDLSVAFRGAGGSEGKAAREVKALDQVGFRLAAGELLVVLGHTGAGKTTLLRALAGLERPLSGRIVEEGEGRHPSVDISTLPPHKRDVAMVFQNFSLYPRLKVGDNLAFPLRAPALRLPEAEVKARVGEAAAFLGLADKLERMPHELSGGEMQRVAIGRALVRRPKLFLLDEPLANLDAKLRERMVVEIRRLQRSLGAAMIYVTHDHAEAMSLADRILVLDGGRVLQAGPPEEIYRHPADSRVARMLGRPSINILEREAAARLGLVEAHAAARPPEGRPAPALIGVRPESWRVTADPAGPAVVAVVEHLGPRMAVVLDVQGILLRALAAPTSRLKAGDRARLGVDPSDILHFDQ